LPGIENLMTPVAAGFKAYCFSSLLVQTADNYNRYQASFNISAELQINSLVTRKHLIAYYLQPNAVLRPLTASSIVTYSC
jgi:hypothetical protein